jgi:hypothetical protein
MDAILPMLPKQVGLAVRVQRLPKNQATAIFVPGSTVTIPQFSQPTGFDMTFGQSALFFDVVQKGWSWSQRTDAKIYMSARRNRPVDVTGAISQTNKGLL